MHDSYYAASANKLNRFSALEESRRCDVCVIGAGYTGLSCALNLAEKDYSVIVLEAERIGWGASGRNGGQVGSGLNWSQQQLEKQYGFQKALSLWQLCELAKQEVHERIKKHSIACDFKHGVVAAAVTHSAARQYAAQVEHMHTKYDYRSLRFVGHEEISDMLGTTRYLAGALDLSSGHLHPMNYAIGLAKSAASLGVQIFENSKVESYQQSADGVTIETSTGARVQSKYLVFACNAYIGKLAPEFSRFIMPISSYIVATEPLGNETARQINRDDIAVHDSKFCLDYYRLSSDKRLLFGGAERYLRNDQINIEAKVAPRIGYLYPQLKGVKIDYAWSGKIAITVNRLPSIGRVSPTVYFAQGFSGHGVALTNLTGRIIAETIAGVSERFDILASIPHRKFPGGDALHWPIHVLTMLYFNALDKLNVWADRFNRSEN